METAAELGRRLSFGQPRIQKNVASLLFSLFTKGTSSDITEEMTALNFSKAIGLLALLCALTCAIDARAVERSDMLRRSLEYSRYLTTPAGLSPEQRALLSVTMATAQSDSVNPTALPALLRLTSELTTYFLISDTSFNWESEAWVGRERSSYGYDSDGRQIQVVSDTGDGVNWTHEHQNIKVYDSDDRLSTSTDQSWQLSAWVNALLLTCTYNDSDYQTQSLYQLWAGSTWVNYKRLLYTYSSGRIDSTVIQLWQSTSSTWQNSSKYTYAFDGSGNLITWLMQSWQGGTWVNLSRVTHTYSIDGDLVQTLTEIWQTGAWANGSKSDYAYDASHHEILAANWMWHTTYWKEEWRDTSKYSGDLLTEVVEVNLLTAGVSRTQYSYDAYGNQTQTLYQEWNATGQEWVNDFRKAYVYQAPTSTCGDFNGSGDVNIADVVYLVEYIFNHGPAPKDKRGGDIDCDSLVTIADAVHFVAYIFSGGPAPCASCP